MKPINQLIFSEVLYIFLKTYFPGEGNYKNLPPLENLLYAAHEADPKRVRLCGGGVINMLYAAHDADPKRIRLCGGGVI